MQKVLFLLVILMGCISCGGDGQLQKNERNNYQQIEGRTMGTIYRITYEDATNQNIQPGVDSVLMEVNSGVNTYDSTSVITRFNRSEKVFELDINTPPVKHFLRNWQLAQKVHEATDGDFDPTVMPLVNYWGFGYQGRMINQVDSARVDSLVQFVGLDKVSFEELSLTKQRLGVQLDFSACAKGYGVDQVGLFLESQGIQNYLVDIGGEVRAKGQSNQMRPWRIGINTPKEDAQMTDYEVAISLKNLSSATSGNYRNFYELNGVKYSHTINPITGFPERNRLLSASVFAQDCMTADAYATAFMVMGVERAFDLANETPGVEAYLIYSDDNGQMQAKYTALVEQWIVK